MALRNSSNVCFIMIFVTFLFLTSTLSHDGYTLKNNKICALSKRELKMQKSDHYVVIVKNGNYFESWVGDYTFNCSFSVVPPSGRGTIVVFQNLEFRQNETNGECIDYVQFYNYEKTFGVFQRLKGLSKKFCGKLNSSQSPNPESILFPDEVASNAYIAPSGFVEAVISVANQPLKPGEFLDFSIVFTAFTHCSPTSPNHCGKNICIEKELFGDKLVHCPFTDCADEKGCPNVVPVERRFNSGLTTKVVIGIVLIILLLLLLFMLCLCMCRHCHMLCWSNSSSSRQQSTCVEMTPHNIGEGETGFQPSAPSLANVTPSPSEDKDLPPPYESLFPTR